MRIRIQIAGGQFEVIEADEIEYLEAQGKETKIFLTGKHEIFADETIGKIEEVLNKKKFIRTHDGYIVNMDKIKSYLKETDIGIKYFLTESDGIAYISKRKVKEVIEIFKNYFHYVLQGILIKNIAYYFHCIFKLIKK